MQSPNHPPRFFNRPHAVQGMQLLAMVFCLLGVIFAGIDALGTGHIRSSTPSWSSAAIVLSTIAGILARNVRSGVRPLLTGLAVGLLYLGAVWLWQRPEVDAPQQRRSE